MKSFKYHILAAMLFWMLVTGGSFLWDQKEIDACVRAGKVFDYDSFRCVSQNPEAPSSYLKVRYARYAFLSITLLLYVGAVTVFYVSRAARQS